MERVSLLLLVSKDKKTPLLRSDEYLARHAEAVLRLCAAEGGAALQAARDAAEGMATQALRVLAAEYGHLGGAIDLFAAFAALPGAQRGAMPAVEFVQTHPLTALRSAAVAGWAHVQGVPLDGARRPLPPALAAIRAAARKP